MTGKGGGNKAPAGLDIQAVADLADLLGVVVDDRDVDILARQVAGYIEADLAGAADDDLHGIMSCPAGRSANGFRP